LGGVLTVMQSPRFLLPVADKFLCEFDLYETFSRFYIVGHTNDKKSVRLLTIDRTASAGLHVSEHDSYYSLSELEDILANILTANKAHVRPHTRLEKMMSGFSWLTDLTGWFG
jgi:hypothetical protein